MTADSSPRLITLGQLTRDFIITPAGSTVLDIPGGDAIFSAAGMCFWNKSPGICARVSELYPESWIDTFEENGINTSGIIPHPEISDLIRFYAYSEPEIVTQDNPITHFAQMDLPIPKTLLGYTNPIQQNDSQTQIDVHNVHPRGRANHLPGCNCIPPLLLGLCCLQYPVTYP